MKRPTGSPSTRTAQRLRKRHPAVDFARFGAAGNIFRHAYGTIDYGIVWDDILGGPDVAAMESLLEAEVPFYQRNFQKTSKGVGRDPARNGMTAAIPYGASVVPALRLFVGSDR